MPTNHLLKHMRPAAIAAAVVLLIPAAAMQLTSEVNWGPEDFLAAAMLLFVSGTAYSLWAQRARTSKQRVLIGVAVFIAFATLWAELAVGLFS